MPPHETSALRRAVPVRRSPSSSSRKQRSDSERRDSVGRDATLARSAVLGWIIARDDSSVLDRGSDLASAHPSSPEKADAACVRSGHAPKQRGQAGRTANRFSTIRLPKRGTVQPTGHGDSPPNNVSLTYADLRASCRIPAAPSRPERRLPVIGSLLRSSQTARALQPPAETGCSG